MPHLWTSADVLSHTQHPWEAHTTRNHKQTRKHAPVEGTARWWWCWVFIAHIWATPAQECEMCWCHTGRVCLFVSGCVWVAAKNSTILLFGCHPHQPPTKAHTTTCHCKHTQRHSQTNNKVATQGAGAGCGMVWLRWHQLPGVERHLNHQHN